jgi:two-component system chemotaxis sensor kinase CheA
MNLDMSQFTAIFVDEAHEHLAAMEAQLLAIQVEAVTKAELNEIFRAAHSIKGGSATFGLSDVTGVAHELESLLDRLRNGELALTREMVDALLKARDVIAQMIAAFEGKGSVDTDEVVRVCEVLRQLATGSGAAPVMPVRDGVSDAAAAPAASDAAPTRATSEPAPPRPAPAGVAVAAASSTPAASSAPASAAVPAAATLPPGDGTSFGFFDGAPASPVQTAPSRGSSPSFESSSIRVSVEKVDQIINLVGELVITQAMLAQTAASGDSRLQERLSLSLAQLDRNTRDLQEAAMSIRMMPISSVFNRFPRVVRDLAARLGKQVELRLVGETTELDKGLIEKISDPLTHLVRNSLDHGIETPAERVASGKCAMGVVTLMASHQGGNIVIEVRDDGRGLDRDRILAKAHERGIAVPENPHDEEVWALIFEPGFSTAAAVTDVSGRGVGMDVVRSNIVALGGRVEIHSEAGRGTCMTVRLPLTLAILDGMSVSCGDEVFILPLNSIVESLRPAPDAVKTVGSRGRVVLIRGEYLPVVALADMMGLQGRVSAESDGILVVVETGQRRVALFVDTLLGQHQVVIKSLESNFRKVSGVSGATIMGDGRVALILDASGLARMAAPRSSEPSFVHA